MLRSLKKGCSVLLVSVLLAATGVDATGAGPNTNPSISIGDRAEAFKLTDYQGREWQLSDFDNKKVIVISFIGTQCPLAKMYSTRLVELESHYRDQNVAFIAVDPNIQDSLAEMAAHAKKFKIEFPFVKDPSQQLADHLGATRTPEVCVLDSNRLLRYRGRIDDQYGIGYAKDKLGAQELVDAIESLVNNREVVTSSVAAPGCLIGRKHTSTGTEALAADGKHADLNYSSRISRILQSRCVSCHRPGDIGPMDLSNYEDASAWADMIAEVTRDGRMPPWHASREHGEFENDRRMNKDEIDALQNWAQAGTPRGNPADDPEPLKFVDGWQIPREPDLVVSMRDKPFKVPAYGDIKYQYFVADPGLKQDTWVNGMEIVPGNRAVVHHVLVFVRPKGSKKRDLGGERGFLVGYVPGTRVELMPQGMAKRIPANSELVFQVHYTPVGSEQLDLSKVGFWIAEPSTITHEVLTSSSLKVDFRIPPNEANYETSAMQPDEMPEAELLSLSPHMHLRGKAFRYTAVYPDGKREVLLDIPKYDFNWQTEYRLKEPKKVPKGTRIFCEAVFDNSKQNLNNPNPDAWVTWGDQTYEEMMIGYFHMSVPAGKTRR